VGVAGDAELGEVVQEGEEDEEKGPDVVFEGAEEMDAEFVGEGGGGDEKEAEEGIEGGFEDQLGDGGEEIEEDECEAGPDGADDGEDAAAHEGDS
jgi:hypothetical protein